MKLDLQRDLRAILDTSVRGKGSVPQCLFTIYSFIHCNLPQVTKPSSLWSSMELHL